MDFIGPLPKSRGYDSIAVVVDKLTKLVHLIATKTTVTAKEFAFLFFNNVIRLHGVPEAIITDRDTRFTSSFWRELMKLMSIEQRMSSAFHPQSDGQTERANRTLEAMLRHYVNERNDDWSNHLTAAEIAINNCQQASTKFSPFFMNYGFNPRFPFLVQARPNSNELSTVPAVEEMFKTIQKTTQQAITNLKHAQRQQSYYANQRRREGQFKVGEQVYVSTANMNITSGVNKLNPKFIGPFPILKVINPVAVQLELPDHYKIHNSFHVSKVRRAKTTEQFPNRPVLEKPPPIIKADNDQESEWEIEKIVDKRRRRNRVEYLVKWKGYDSHDNQWLPVSQLTNSRDVIKDFEESLNSIRLSSVLSSTPIVKPHYSSTISTTSTDNQSVNQQSTVPQSGLGLLMDNQPFNRNRSIVPYTGQTSTKRIDGDYVLEVNRRHFINANRHIDTAGFANECLSDNENDGLCQGNNSRFTVNQRNHTANIKAIKTIPPHTEIFIPYGDEYWKDIDNVKRNKQQIKRRQVKLKQQ